MAAQVRPELAVPLPAQMALNPILDRVVGQRAPWCVQSRAVFEPVHRTEAFKSIVVLAVTNPRVDYVPDGENRSHGA